MVRDCTDECVNLFGMKRLAKVQRAYHTRISDPDGTLEAVLVGYAEFHGRTERALFAGVCGMFFPGFRNGILQTDPTSSRVPR